MNDPAVLHVYAIQTPNGFVCRMELTYEDAVAWARASSIDRLDVFRYTMSVGAGLCVAQLDGPVVALDLAEATRE